MSKIQLLFLVDSTMPMRVHRTAIMERIAKEIAEAESEYDSVQVARIDYYDYDEHEALHMPSVLPFTSEVHEALRRIPCKEDPDRATDITSALYDATQLAWDMTALHEIIHISGGPPHGWNYHEPWFEDRYPKGDPRMRDLEVYLRALQGTDVSYTLFKTHESMDVFAHILEEYFGEKFMELDLVTTHYKMHLGEL